MNWYILVPSIILGIFILLKLIDAWIRSGYEPNYVIQAFGVCYYGRVEHTTKHVFAFDEKDAIRQAKALARAKDFELGMKYPNHSMYEDGSYPNSIGTSWRCYPIEKLNEEVDNESSSDSGEYRSTD